MSSATRSCAPHEEAARLTVSGARGPVPGPRHRGWDDRRIAPAGGPRAGVPARPAQRRSSSARRHVTSSRRLLGLLGPAFVAAVAYVDPGNFATNISSGASFGYRLVWVVLLANLMAMPVQYLSAKLGIVTGRSLPELSRDHLPGRSSGSCGYRRRRWR